MKGLFQLGIGFISTDHFLPAVPMTCCRWLRIDCSARASMCWDSLRAALTWSSTSRLTLGASYPARQCRLLLVRKGGGTVQMLLGQHCRVYRTLKRRIQNLCVFKLKM